VAGGERTEGEKGGGYVIVSRDGLRLQIRDKSNLQVRCDQLEFMWRAAEKGLWEHIAGSGYKLQAEVEGEARTYRTCRTCGTCGGAACRISHPKGRQSVALNSTAIAKSPKILEQFMKVDSLEQFRFSTHFAPDDLLPRDALEELAREAIASSDGNYGIQEAVKWAEGFEFPQELVDSDMRLFRASQLDCSAMERRWLEKIGATRISARRVEQLRADNPERSRPFDIANGMRVPLPSWTPK
jgi:hypothetical protein